MATTTIGLKVDLETRDRLKALAEAKDRSPHWVLKRALTEYLEREEHKEQERIEDEERWERYLLTGEAVPHDRVRKWLRALADGQDVPPPR